MVKVMSLCSAARTHNALGWVSIIWFTSAVSISGSQVDLQVEPQVEAKCGTNVTLTCEATSRRTFDIILFSWVNETNVMCSYGKEQPDPEFPCERSQHKLALTLHNVMPANKGKYLCKLQSNVGISGASTFVTVRGCHDKSGYSINESHAECWFTGVYPSGVVHWFQGDVNLTDSARTREEEDGQGLFKVLSDLNVDERNLSLPYKCSLWIPTDGKYLLSQKTTSPEKIRSSGSPVTLQRICVVVWLVSFLDCIWKS
ncbi:butyrophilin subfamily 3 member A2 [Hippoglossus stenolepis]|uniref:butyrophilin subfamily 3 member A2 n=1 Tax=Hippoglossus stenolepis TaxID=195615 RepID=UPI00159C3600|nr:butyrophilin subfamily 3 member A2 [Hippoglossus stenolepis]XP_035035610.1 butyrophilin subfamily 3 member A2 [Hippoglossus stenolepis]